jgi:hypothetical protein
LIVEQWSGLGVRTVFAKEKEGLGFSVYALLANTSQNMQIYVVYLSVYPEPIRQLVPIDFLSTSLLVDVSVKELHSNVRL